MVSSLSSLPITIAIQKISDRKLYKCERNLVESSDCSFLEHKLFDWMGSLRYMNYKVAIQILLRLFYRSS